MNRYLGPDREFGEHDDYKVGDLVRTYDGDDAEVLSVRRYDEQADGPFATIYEVSNPRVTARRFDGSRLALIKRAEPATEQTTQEVWADLTAREEGQS